MSTFSFPLGSYFLRKCRLFNGMHRPWTKFIAYTWIIKLKVTSDLCKKKNPCLDQIFSLLTPSCTDSQLQRLSVGTCSDLESRILVKGARSSFLSPPEIKVKTKSYKCFFILMSFIEAGPFEMITMSTFNYISKNSSLGFHSLWTNSTSLLHWFKNN